MIKLFAILALSFMVIGSLTNSVLPYLISSGLALLVIVFGIWKSR